MVSDRSNGGNWRIIFAIAGLIIGIALGAACASLYYTEKQQQETVATNTNTKNQSKIPQQYLTPRAGMPATIEGVISNPQPTTGQDHEKRDLAAQEASATFAWWMVVVTVFSVLITGLGTALLYQQVILTREAVEDTGLATNAMNRQNDLTERAQRPFLYIEGMGWEQPKDSPVGFFVLTLKNFGQTPARNCKIRADFRFSTKREPPKVWRLREIAASDIVPQSKIVTAIVESGDTRLDGNRDELMTEHAYCRFEIRYADAAENEYGHFETHMQINAFTRKSDGKFRFFRSP